MKLELKPCPFCGAHPHHGLGKVERCQLHGEPFQRGRVWCPTCLIEKSGASIELAAHEWNRSDATTPHDVDGLVERLRGTHTCDGCGEYVGSIIHDLCDEAATALSSERAAHEQTKTRLAEVEKALKPFAKFSDVFDAGIGNYPNKDHQDFYTVASSKTGELSLLVGDFRAARRALTGDR